MKNSDIKTGLFMRKIAALVISVLCFFILLLVVAAYPGEIEFADSGLENAIRDLTGVYEQPLTSGLVFRITDLDASERNIERLDGIENLRRLKSLNLDKNRVKDLTPLRELKNLEHLSLRDNKITDIEKIGLYALADSGLKSLNLRHNVVRHGNGKQTRLSDISVLSKFASLEELYLRDNYIADIKPLASLTELRVLDLRENHIEDIPVLENLVNLRKLNIRGNSIRDITPLKDLTNLIYLNIHSNTGIKDFEPLRILVNLETLIMRNVPIGGSIDAISGMSNLYRVNLRNCSIGDTKVLGELMSRGALQDIPGSGVRADVDIRDNPFDKGGVDPYIHIRPYWDYISDPSPDRLPEGSVSSPEFSMPAGFYEKEFYLTLSSESRDIKIYYTLNGSEPDPEKNSDNTFLYKGPLRIYDRTEKPNTISEIDAGYGDWSRYSKWEGPSGNIFKASVVRAKSVKDGIYHSDIVTKTYLVNKNIGSKYRIPVMSIVTDPDNLFDYERGIYAAGKIFDDTNPFWRIMNPGPRPHYHPANFHQRGRIFVNAGGVKAQRFRGGKTAFSIPEHGLPLDFSYLRVVPQITIRGTEKYDGIHYLDPASNRDMLVIQSGYIPETLPIAARIEHNWERPVHLEFFEADGSAGFMQNLGLRIHGGSSRQEPKKSLRLYARNYYDSSNVIDYDFFKDNDTTQHRRLILRRSDERSGLNHVLGHMFMRMVHPEMDIMRFHPAVVLINGEFWGWYGIRNRIDHHHFKIKYGIGIDDLIYLESRGDVIYGKPGDGKPFVEMDKFIRREDLSKQENYEYLKTLIDIDNYIAYMVTGIYIVYTDWQTDRHRNVWRYRTEYDPEAPREFDGRWRWVPQDMDGAFSRDADGPGTYYLKEIIEDRYVKELRHFLPYRYLLKFFLENEEFRNRFINSFADNMNSVFKEEYAVDAVNDITGMFCENLILENERRWHRRDSTDIWNEHVEYIKDFFRKRPGYMREHIIDYFGLSGLADITLKTDLRKGYIRINSLNIRPDTPGIGNPDSWTGIYFRDLPVEIRAVPAPGYRFAGWKGIDSEDDLLNIVVTEDISLTAEFEKK